MRKKIVAGNWKMNKNLFEGKELVDEILAIGVDLSEDEEVIIAPPFMQLPIAASQLRGYSGFSLSAQNCHQSDGGAFTGEVSAEMLKSSGVDYVILGHSERRGYFGESGLVLKAKVDGAFRGGLKVIFCVGEPLEVRESGGQNDYVAAQISESLFHLSDSQFGDIVLAYEPIWAIGTGRTATRDQAQEMHAHIRGVVSEVMGDYTGAHLSILYGGSCKPDNAAALFSEADVDGGLIGGASLNALDFAAIIKSL